MIVPKKWMVSLGAALLTGVLITSAAFAAGGEKEAKAPLNGSPGVHEVMTEIRTLHKSRMEQLKTEIEGLIDKAAAEGKITAEEAARLKEGGKRLQHGPRHGFKGKGHAPGMRPHKFGQNMTEEQMKAKLDAAVQSGRITQEQADQMLKRWQEWQAQQSKTN